MMKNAVILLCSAALLSCSKPVGTLAGGMPNPSPGTPPLALSIVPSEQFLDQPDNNGNRVIYAGQTFYVVLTNVSDKPVPIFEEWSSWGFFNISFEAVTAGGKTVKLAKGGISVWGINAPAIFSIPPGGHFIFAEQFFKERWPNLSEMRLPCRNLLAAK